MSGTGITVEQRPAQLLASVRRKIPAPDLGDTIGAMLDEVYEALPDNPVGPPVVRYHGYGATVDLEVGFPVEMPVPGLRTILISAGPAAVAEHRGHYDGLAAVTREVSDWVEANARLNGPPMEIYLTNPRTTPVAELRTQIVWPVVID